MPSRMFRAPFLKGLTVVGIGQRKVDVAKEVVFGLPYNRIRARAGGSDSFVIAALLVILKASSGNTFESLHLF